MRPPSDRGSRTRCPRASLQGNAASSLGPRPGAPVTANTPAETHPMASSARRSAPGFPGLMYRARVCVSLCVSGCVSMCMPVSVYLCVCLGVCLYVSVTVCVSVCLCLGVYTCVCLCVCTRAHVILLQPISEDTAGRHSGSMLEHPPDPLWLLPVVDQVQGQASWVQGGGSRDAPWGLTSGKHQGGCPCAPGKARRPSAGLFQLPERQQVFREHLLCPACGGQTQAENEPPAPGAEAPGGGTWSAACGLGKVDPGKASVCQEDLRLQAWAWPHGWPGSGQVIAPPQLPGTAAGDSLRPSSCGKETL